MPTILFSRIKKKTTVARFYLSSIDHLYIIYLSHTHTHFSNDFSQNVNNINNLIGFYYHPYTSLNYTDSCIENMSFIIRNKSLWKKKLVRTLSQGMNWQASQSPEGCWDKWLGLLPSVSEYIWVVLRTATSNKSPGDAAVTTGLGPALWETPIFKNGRKWTDTDHLPPCNWIPIWPFNAWISSWPLWSSIFLPEKQRYYYLLHRVVLRVTWGHKCSIDAGCYYK